MQRMIAGRAANRDELVSGMRRNNDRVIVENKIASIAPVIDGEAAWAE
jgi:hypothetical protein